MCACEKCPTTPHGRQRVSTENCATVCIGHKVMRATNSWAMNWADKSDWVKWLDGY